MLKERAMPDKESMNWERAVDYQAPNAVERANLCEDPIQRERAN